MAQQTPTTFSGSPATGPAAASPAATDSPATDSPATIGDQPAPEAGEGNPPGAGHGGGATATTATDDGGTTATDDHGASATTATPATDDHGATATTATDGAEPQGDVARLRRLGPWGDRAVSLGLAVVTLAVYLRSLLPGTGYSGDTAKFQFLGVVGGVPHATGYPLYVALDQAFVGTVPWGSPAWRANLLSAVLGVASVVVLHHVLRRLGVRLGVAAATALTFAFTTTFWSQAVVAEVYTLHVFLLVATTACLARWRMEGANGWLLLGLGLYALDLSHHSTAVLAIPGVVWLVAADWRRALTRWNVVALVAMGVGSASLYLYLLWMNDVGGYVENPILDLGDVLDYVQGGPFQNRLFTFGPSEILRDRVPLLIRFVWDEVWVLLLPVAFGAWRGLRTADRARRDVAVHFLLLGLATGVFVLNYDVPDIIVFTLPLFLALAVFLGLGLEGAVAWLTAWRPGSSAATRRAPAVGAVAALVALPLVVGLVDYRQASQRGAQATEQRIERAIEVADRDAVLLTDDYHDSMYVLYYLLGEGLGDERNLVLGREVTPAHVVSHLRGDGGPVTHVADEVGAEGRRPELYTATPHQAMQLIAAGVDLTEVAPSVWRVEGLTDARE